MIPIINHCHYHMTITIFVLTFLFRAQFPSAAQTLEELPGQAKIRQRRRLSEEEGPVAQVLLEQLKSLHVGPW
jgi:hypothetical protein